MHVNIVAHDLTESIKEHENMTGTAYPFIHNTDDYLHDVLFKTLQER